ncbi:MAG: SPASM domain-containing protein [Oscillospiraceae bacterium]|nr:SPASM domain-containing protein [Oscillospiraceae bacterium]
MYARAYLEITNICNRSCSFCPGTVRPLRRMTMEEFQIAARKIRSVTEYLYFHIMGEPLTHPLLPDFIRYARELGFKPAVTTNGTLLKTRGKELIDANVYKVNISVHSFEDGEYEDYIRYLTDCADFAREASEAGVLTVLRLWNQGCDEGRNIDTEEFFREHLEGEWKKGGRGYRIKNKLHLEFGDRFTWPDMACEDGGDSVFCYGLKDHFGVLCDGRVIPCCLDREGVIALGNLFTDDLEAVLNSDRADAMRKGFKQRRATEELCRKCGYARRFG